MAVCRHRQDMCSAAWVCDHTVVALRDVLSLCLMHTYVQPTTNTDPPPDSPLSTTAFKWNGYNYHSHFEEHVTLDIFCHIQKVTILQCLCICSTTMITAKGRWRSRPIATTAPWNCCYYDKTLRCLPEVEQESQINQVRMNFDTFHCQNSTCWFCSGFTAAVLWT